MKITAKLRKPIYKDWIFWLYMLGNVAILNSVISPKSNGTTASGPADVVLELVIIFLFFLILPATIREVSAEKKKTQGPSPATRMYSSDSKNTGTLGKAHREWRDARKQENRRVGYKKPLFASLSSTFYLSCNHQILVASTSDHWMTGRTVFCDVCQAERQITKRIEKRS